MHTRSGKPFDARRIGQRLQERDQHLAVPQLRGLFGCRCCNFCHDIRAPRVADLRARFGVRRVGEARGVARARFDDHFDAVAESRHRLRDESNTAFAFTDFLWNPQPHQTGDAIANGGPYTAPRVTDLLISYGLVLLFALIAAESAGVPLPGETALIAAAILAARGHYSIVWVIVVAATAAIIGDNIGYWIGRTGGRALLERWGPVRRYAERALPPGERFFKKHGGKTVFIGRFVAVLRVTAAWLAGITHMSWWRFFLWNAAGGIVWATGVSLLAYYFGKAAADAVATYGVYALIVIVVGVVIAFVVMRLLKKRIEPS
jgi:membrane protein DedA with SNARE-associated domain